MDELFETMIFKALQVHATDIHIKLDETLHIEFRVLGQLEHYQDYDIELGSKLMNYLKYKSFINVNYRLVPQTGSFHYFIQNHIYFLRVSYLPGLHFESIVIRILNNHDKISLGELSTIKPFTKFLNEICHCKNGLFLVAGATGSGKSTTLYALLDRLIDMGGKNIVTLEDPIEMKKEHCLQIELNELAGIDYASSLRQILRHDPDILMIGEIRDEETAKLAITAALTGHLVLSTIHANNAPLVIKRMLNLGVNQTDLNAVLVGIVAQKIKYDIKNQKVIVLPEMMNKEAIHEYLLDEDYHYMTFKESANFLLREGTCESYLLEEELYE